VSRTKTRVRKPPSRAPEVISWLLFAVALVYAAYEVYRLRWVCDDAFISMRYAQNLVRGLGLVFNAGEKVEGYTNFLWTLFMAGGLKTGVNPVGLTMVLGALSYFGTVATFAVISWRLIESAAARFFLPVTALALLLHHDAHIYATSGLETAWVTLLISAGFALLLLGRSTRAALAAGLILTLSVLSRPDAMIFVVAGLVFLVWEQRRINLRVLAFIAPLVLIYAPYWLWRYNYYGYPFPNTYYAKSAYLPYYEQGWRYIGLYARSYYLFYLVPLLALLLIGQERKRLLAPTRWHDTTRALVLTLLFLVPYVAYVVRVGGDFMFARFLIPVTPLLLFVFELTLRSLTRHRSLILGLGLLVPLLVLARHHVFATENIIDGIVDEHEFYPSSWHESAQRQGEKLRKYFKGQPVKVAFFGTFAAYVYYAEPSYAIEANTGLTDVEIAHQPVARRGRPGHEKPASAEYLTRRQVHFVFRRAIPVRTDAEFLRYVEVGDFSMMMLTYDPDVMDHLATYRDVRFVNVQDYIDELIPQLPKMDDPSARRVYEFMQLFYFNRSPDSARSKPFEERLEAAAD
jgi:hypothetical protein